MRTRRLLPLAAATALLVLLASPAHAADTTAPTAPGLPVASDLTEYSVTLTWTPSTDDTGVTYYEVWRTYTDMVMRAASPTTNTATINNLPRGSVNRFSVVAFDAAGNRSLSSGTITVITLPGDLEPPGPIFGVTASEITDTSVLLDWIGPMWGDAEIFRVHRGQTGVPTVVVETLPVTQRTFVVTGLSPGTRYFLGVSAVDAAGNQSSISLVTVTTTGTPPPATCSVKYSVTSQWTGAFNADVQVTNLAPAAVTGWTVRWTYAGTQRITNMWNASPSQSGAAVAASDAGHNATLGASGGSQSFGFQATFTGGNSDPVLFTLNNQPCVTG